jgi:ubiquinone/menaquinone biosynthesis C-methylase UbiE
MTAPPQGVSEHFDRLAEEYDAWKEKAWYYYEMLADIYRAIIPAGASVLEIGCGTGTLLAEVRPSRGVGVDISPEMIRIASAKHPEIAFRVMDAATLSLPDTFDFVMIPDVVEHLADVPATFRALRGVCHPATRVVLTCVNPIWAPVLHLAERLKMKMPEGDHRWLPKGEIVRIGRDAGFRMETHLGRILLPKRIPLLSRLLNRLAERVGSLAPVCMTHVYVFTIAGALPATGPRRTASRKSGPTARTQRAPGTPG